MKLPLTQPKPRVAAFTMVEIAISLAVIAFALVAIIGVLPSGLTVQRENREETIINQDASVWSSAIRNGERGFDDLTNYVYAITNYWKEWQVDTNAPGQTNVLNRPREFDGYDWFTSDVNSFAPAPVFRLTNGMRIVGLMSRPKYEQTGPDTYRSNHVVAFVRAMSGLATEKPPQTNADVRLDAFAYRLICENQQSPGYIDPVQLSLPAGSYTNLTRQLTNNLRELRLHFRWPVSTKGVPGNGRQVFRSLVAGHPHVIPDPTAVPPHPLYFFRPTMFEKAQP